MSKYCKNCGIKIGQNSKTLLCKICYQKKWKLSHKEYISNYNKQWEAEHRNVRAIYNKTWCSTHKDKRAASKHRSFINMKNDPLKRFKDSVRHNIKDAVIRRTKYSSCKSKKTENILGCSIDYFMEYISSLFQDGMSWDNYGMWHLDHIKPLKLASSKEEVYDLCHYTNYQPLWAEDNLKKGAIYGSKKSHM